MSAIVEHNNIAQKSLRLAAPPLTAARLPEGAVDVQVRRALRGTGAPQGQRAR